MKLGMGIVIRDHVGEIWAAKCVYMQGYLEAYDASFSPKTIGFTSSVLEHENRGEQSIRFHFSLYGQNVAY
jgi:hypothetical protein